MVDVPRDLLEQIAQLEKLLTVETTKLCEIVDHFVKELEKGEFYNVHHHFIILNRWYSLYLNRTV